LVSLSVKGQGFLKSFHHPCILRCDVIIWGNSHCFDFPKHSRCSVCRFLYFRQEDPRFLTRASMEFSTSVQVQPIIQPSSVSRAIEPVAFLFIRPVTKS
ncbi:hypothetical protein T03_16124, partial [Trichinella britovi]